MVTVESLREKLDRDFGGLLRAGKHTCSSGEVCAMELLTGGATDEPNVARCWDIRPLNDIRVTDEIRTKHLLPVLAAYADSMDWPEARQKAVAEKLVVLTVQRIVADLPGLSQETRCRCLEADTLDKAAEAAAAAGAAEEAWATEWEAAWAAEWTAATEWAAARAAWAAREAEAAAREAAREAAAAAREAEAAWAAEAAREKAIKCVFVAACQAWVDAAA